MENFLTSTEAKLDVIVLQAREDYRRAPTEYRPPYPIGSKEFDAYERGWMQALKRNPEANTTSRFEWVEEDVLSPRIAPSYNAYANRKG
jgi:hypothetical protein